MDELINRQFDLISCLGKIDGVLGGGGESRAASESATELINNLRRCVLASVAPAAAALAASAAGPSRASEAPSVQNLCLIGQVSPPTRAFLLNCTPSAIHVIAIQLGFLLLPFVLVSGLVRQGIQGLMAGLHGGN
jgi:hypothetical protein